MLAGGKGRDRALGGVRVEYASISGVHRIRWAGSLSDQHGNHVPPGILKMYRKRPDVVHAHDPGSGYTASLLKKYDGTPYVLTVHLAPSLAGPGQACRLAYKKALEGASTVISASKYIKGHIKKDFGMDSVVIPRSVGAMSDYMALYDDAVMA